MKKSILLLTILLILVSCTKGQNPDIGAEPTPTPEVSSTFAEQLRENYSFLEGEVYFEELKSEELERFLKHGTGVLYLSFPECPWCQQYLPILNTLLGENGMSAYYYNIYPDKTANAAFYDKIAGILEETELGKDIIHYNNEGRAVIYMPLTLFLQEGKIIAFESETNDISSKDYNPFTYWTEQKKKALLSRMQPSLEAVKLLLEKKEKEGCENACGFPENPSETN